MINHRNRPGAPGFAALAALAVTLGAPPLRAQYPAPPGPGGMPGETPRTEIFGGAALLCSGCNQTGRELFGGWQTDVSHGITDNISAAAGFSGVYRSFSGIGFSQYNYLFGPRYNHRTDRTNAFAHFMFGGARLSGGGGSLSGFSFAIGGGFDVNAGKNLAIRAFQLDLIPTHFSSGLASTWSRDVRLGVGLVFKFGGK